MVPAHRGIFQQKESRIFSPIDIWLVFYQTATDRCPLFLSAFYNQAWDLSTFVLGLFVQGF